MKNPNKAQRHAIYKRALVRFNKHPNGLCLIIGDIHGCDWWEVPYLFPEFTTQYNPKDDNYYGKTLIEWCMREDAMPTRRHALLRCIEMSAPKPRKKP